MSKMESQRFALGRVKKETKKEKRKRIREKRKQTIQRSYKPLARKQIWRILPNEFCEGLGFWIDTLKGETYIQKLESLRSQMNHVDQISVSPFRFPPSKVNWRQDYKEKVKRIFILLQMNQELRWRLKYLITRMRCSLLKKTNETDPFTFEPFHQPITFPSYQTKVIYTFEAESFAKYVHKQLLHNDGHIPFPIFPRNPLTNEEFTVPQLLGLFRQCRAYGQTFWTVDAFQKMSCSQSQFFLLYNKPLRIQALYSVIKNVDTWDCIDTLFDFIKTQHVSHGKPCLVNIYKVGLRHFPYHTKLVQWRKLCMKWYEVDILFEDPDRKDIEFEKLELLTLPLCELPVDLKSTCHAFLKQQRREHGGGDTTDSESDG